MPVEKISRPIIALVTVEIPLYSAIVRRGNFQVRLVSVETRERE